MSDKKKTLKLSRGPLMVDVAGHTLTKEEKKRLRHPLVGAVILFARNYENREQLCALTRSIHQLRSPQLLIAVDHEGGRVQRFRTDGFSVLPSMIMVTRTISIAIPATAMKNRRNVLF